MLDLHSNFIRIFGLCLWLFILYFHIIYKLKYLFADAPLKGNYSVSGSGLNMSVSVHILAYPMPSLVDWSSPQNHLQIGTHKMWEDELNKEVPNPIQKLFPNYHLTLPVCSIGSRGLHLPSESFSFRWGDEQDLAHRGKCIGQTWFQLRYYTWWEFSIKSIR